MEIWYINLRKSLVIQTSLISLDVSLNVLGEQGIILDIIRQTACLVFNQIMVDDIAALFSCMAVVQA